MTDAGSTGHGLGATLTLPMAFCISLKQVIGGGVVVLTGTAVALTGAGAAPAYGLACAVVLLAAFPMRCLGRRGRCRAACTVGQAGSSADRPVSSRSGWC